MHVLRVCSVFEPSSATPLDRPEMDPIGGMQFHTGQLTRVLDRRGIHQTVVTAYRPGAPRHERLGDFANVHRVGVDTSRLRQRYAIHAARTVADAARRATIVHAHLGEDIAVLPLASAAARRHDLPLVVTIHCSLRHTLRARSSRLLTLRTFGGAIERRATARAAAVITLTQRTRRLLLADGIPADAVQVIPSGVDPSLFRDDPADHHRGTARPQVTFVGRLSPQKSVGTLLAALPHVRTDVDTIVVGDGPERARLERSARRLPPNRRVTFTGFEPHGRIPGRLRRAAVLVLPSAYEELGSILLEAMAAGAPVIATDTGGIPEVIQDGVTGLLVPPADPIALAHAIDRVVSDPGLADRLAGAAAAGSSPYHWPVLAQQVEGVYRRVSSDARGAVPV